MTVKIVSPNNLERFAQKADEKFAEASHTHDTASVSANGFMSSTDKARLDSLDTVITLPRIAYGTLPSKSTNAATYFREWLIYCIANYGSIMRSGKVIVCPVNPNSEGTCIGWCYTDSEVDSNGLPRYSTFIYIPLGNTTHYRFGTNNYTFYYAAGDTNTTYSSKAAASGGTDVSLVTTGEKYTWNSKANGSHTHNYAGSASAGGPANSLLNFTAGLNGVAEHDANNIATNGVWYYTSNGPATSLGASTNDGALYSQAYSTTWVGQIAQDYRNGRLFVRGKNNGTWQSWQRIPLYSEVALSGHTHNVSLATDSGTATVTLAHNTTYKLTAGGSNIIFKTPADNNTTYSAGTGISLSGTTFSNSGVRSIATGSANGTISVNTNGTSADVAIKGLGSAAYTSSTDYLGASATAVDSNKLGGTAAASYAKLASPALTGTPTAPTASSGTNTTQIATTAFVQSAIDFKIAAADAMIYKGTIGTSGSTITTKTLPNSTAKTGWTYKVAEAGSYTVGTGTTTGTTTITCEVGDMLICLTDGSSSTYATWTVVQNNIDGAVTGPSSAVDARVAVFNGTTGKIIKDSGYTIAKSVPSDAKFTDTVYTHPTTSGNKHIPSGGSSGQILKYSADGTATWANEYSYTLPNATSSTKGGVIVGSNITVSSGTISLTKANVTSALGYTPPTTNTTYESMSQTEATTGTATTARTISAKVLHTKVESMISDAEPIVQESVLSSALNANTAFTVPNHTVGSKKMLVFFNGILCKQGSTKQYVDASATTITFNDTLPAGSEITIYIV